MRRHATWLLSLALLACEERPPTGAASGAGPVEPPPAVSSSPALPAAPEAVDDETSTRPMELLAFQFTSEVKNRAPTDQLRAGRAGKRVYAHLTLRNRTGRARKIELRFRVAGQPRTELSLEIGESWSWRTWGYNTVLEADRGKKLSLEVVDDEGHPLVDAELPIE